MHVLLKQSYPFKYRMCKSQQQKNRGLPPKPPAAAQSAALGVTQFENFEVSTCRECQKCRKK